MKQVSRSQEHNRSSSLLPGPAMTFRPVEQKNLAANSNVWISEFHCGHLLYNVSVLKKIRKWGGGGRCAQTGHPLKLPSPTKLARLSHFPPASQAGQGALLAQCSMYMSFLWGSWSKNTDKWRGGGWHIIGWRHFWAVLCRCWGNVYITNQFFLGGGGEGEGTMSSWCVLYSCYPVLKNITNSMNIMVIITFQDTTQLSFIYQHQ